MEEMKAHRNCVVLNAFFVLAKKDWECGTTRESRGVECVFIFELNTERGDVYAE